VHFHKVGLLISVVIATLDGVFLILVAPAYARRGSCTTQATCQAKFFDNTGLFITLLFLRFYV